MLKKEITFTNFNDETVTETHYFHLSKAELAELEMSHKGGMEKYLRAIVEAEDGPAIMEEFRKIILMSYGKKSPDGTKFTKNDQIREEFASSEAYSTLFMEIVLGGADAGAAFVNAVMPKGLKEDLAAMGMPERKHPSDPAAQPAPEPPAEEENVFSADNPKILTQAEMLEMDSDELKSGLATGKYKLQ